MGLLLSLWLQTCLSHLLPSDISSFASSLGCAVLSGQAQVASLGKELRMEVHMLWYIPSSASISVRGLLSPCNVSGTGREAQKDFRGFQAAC